MGWLEKLQGKKEGTSYPSATAEAMQRKKERESVEDYNRKAKLSRAQYKYERVEARREKLRTPPTTVAPRNVGVFSGGFQERSMFSEPSGVNTSWAKPASGGIMGSMASMNTKPSSGGIMGGGGILGSMGPQASKLKHHKKQQKRGTTIIIR